SADLGYPRAAVHENVVVWGLDRRLEGFNTGWPVREDLRLQILVEQAAQRNQPVLRKVLQGQLGQACVVVARDIRAQYIQATQQPEFRAQGGQFLFGNRSNVI